VGAAGRRVSLEAVGSTECRGASSASGDKLFTAAHGAKIARNANTFQWKWCAAPLREAHGKRFGSPAHVGLANAKIFVLGDRAI